MAGDWIKMRSDLLTHPKVVRISSALKTDRLRTIGALFSAWCLFDAHSEDGMAMKKRLKNLVIGAYCAGWLPASAVIAAFVIFRLKAE